MVAMGHGLCVFVCVHGETTKNKEESKIVNISYEFKSYISAHPQSNNNIAKSDPKQKSLPKSLDLL
jgi:hypothetical protein